MKTDKEQIPLLIVVADGFVGVSTSQDIAERFEFIIELKNHNDPSEDERDIDKALEDKLIECFEV